MVAHDDDLEDILRVMVTAARTGRIGDGKIWVTPVERVIRVRTGELDDDAI